MESKRNILITGGAGFIGSHVVRLFVNKYPDYHIINLDKLTYAGNLANLHDIKDKPNYTFIKADICDFETVLEIIRKYNVDGIIHLAAESHADRHRTAWNLLSPRKHPRRIIMSMEKNSSPKRTATIRIRHIQRRRRLRTIS